MSICDSDFIQMPWKFDWNERKLETLIFASNFLFLFFSSCLAPTSAAMRAHNISAVTQSQSFFHRIYHFQWITSAHVIGVTCTEKIPYKGKSKQSIISSSDGFKFSVRFGWFCFNRVNINSANAGAQSDVKWALISLKLKSLLSTPCKQSIRIIVFFFLSPVVFFL